MTSTPTAPHGSSQAARTRRPTIRRVVRVVGVAAAVLLVVSGLDRLVRDATVTTDVVQPDGLRAIVVETTAGDVTVGTADRGDVEVAGEITSGMFSDGDVDIRREGDTLRLLGDCDGVVLTACTVRFDVTLPRELAARVEVRTRAGEIQLRGVTGDVDVATTAGTVHLLDFDGQTARIATTAGEIRVEAGARTRALDLRARAGSIDVVVDDTEPWRVDAVTTVGGASVDVATADDADRVLVARTTAGEIDVRGR